MNLDEARARIRERPELNAFISVSDEQGDGQVVAVKDLVDVRGMITTAGAKILPEVPALVDAPAVERTRRAGCVIIGKTNLHEFAFGVTGVNPHYGTVRNPRDVGRIAGGSSSGSAAAVAAGLCDWAIGTDTGGSIRIPAALCGVVGFKPAFGSVPTTGVVPLSPSLDTVGPIGPDVSSTARAYTIISGEDVALAGLAAPRLAVPSGWVSKLDEPTEGAWSLVSTGLPEIEFPDRDRLFQTGLTILLVEAAAYHRRWEEERPESYGADVLAHIRRGLGILGVDFEEALEERSRLQESARRAMEGIDALLVPATAIVAPLVDAGDEVREGLLRFTRPFNTTGQPVAVVPAPVPGLPVGIQIVGRTNADTLRVALSLEEEWHNRQPEAGSNRRD